eukprot:6146455-Prymnesium_polylepis.1
MATTWQQPPARGGGGGCQSQRLSHGNHTAITRQSHGNHHLLEEEVEEVDEARGDGERLRTDGAREG